MKLSIIIPCYNEKDTIREIISRVLSANLGPWQKEVIIVDDGSTDGTREILSKYNSQIRVVCEERNQGKGSAVAHGLELATGDYMLIQDADLEYDPKDIPNILDQIGNERSAVVYGSRNIHYEKRKGFVSQRLGVWAITILINYLYGLRLTDPCTCYKLFPSQAKRHFAPGGFESDILFSAILARNGYSIKEVGISYYPRDKKHGKKIRYRDGFRAIQAIISDRLANGGHSGKIAAPLRK